MRKFKWWILLGYDNKKQALLGAGHQKINEEMITESILKTNRDFITWLRII